MNRFEYMRRLEALLSDISPSEKEEALTYYNDYFNDAGQAVCENVTSRNAVMDIAMGECQYSGKINKDLSVDCGQGNVEIEVDGAEEEHNYDLDCGMGNILVGSMRAAGMGAQQTQDNGADSLYHVKCGMGNVTITFK